MIQESRLKKVKKDLHMLLKRAINDNDIDEKRKIMRVWDWINFTDEWKNINLIEKHIRIAGDTLENGFKWVFYLPVYPNGFVLNDYRIIINSNKKVFSLDSGNEHGWAWCVVLEVYVDGSFDVGNSFKTNQIKGNRKLIEKRRKKNIERKGLGYIKLTPPLNIPFDWHHIDEDHVVAAPTKLHEGIWHSLKNIKSMQRINIAVEEWYNDNNIAYKGNKNALCVNLSKWLN